MMSRCEILKNRRHGALGTGFSWRIAWTARQALDTAFPNIVAYSDFFFSFV